jgi:hypothetical protein
MTTALERLGSTQRTAATLVAQGKVGEALALLAPPRGELEVAQQPDLPKPFIMSPERKAALTKAATFMEKKAVTTAEVRALTAAEIDALIEERDLLDKIAKLVEERKESIRAMAFNHLDVEYRNTHTPDEIKATPLDKKGHFVVDGEVTTPEAVMKLTRNTTGGAPILMVTDLDAVANSGAVGDAFTHEDYLAVTRQERVLDEHLMALHMAKKPEIIEGIAAALRPGTKNTAHNFKAK